MNQITIKLTKCSFSSSYIPQKINKPGSAKFDLVKKIMANKKAFKHMLKSPKASRAFLSVALGSDTDSDSDSSSGSSTSSDENENENENINRKNKGANKNGKKNKESSSDDDENKDSKNRLKATEKGKKKKRLNRKREASSSADEASVSDAPARKGEREKRSRSKSREKDRNVIEVSLDESDNNSEDRSFKRRRTRDRNENSSKYSKEYKDQAKNRERTPEERMNSRRSRSPAERSNSDDRKNERNPNYYNNPEPGTSRDFYPKQNYNRYQGRLPFYNRRGRDGGIPAHRFGNMNNYGRSEKYEGAIDGLVWHHRDILDVAFEEPTDEEITEIKNFIDENYPGVRSFFKKYAHNPRCEYKCYDTFKLNMVHCWKWNNRVYCGKQFGHEEPKTDNNFHNHACSMCHKILHINTPHMAKCQTCPIAEIRREMRGKSTINNAE